MNWASNMAARKTKKTPKHSLDVLDSLIMATYEKMLERMEKNPKLGELIKMIELRHKLTPEGAEQEKFWKKLDDLRRESLGGKTTKRNARKPKAANKR